MDILRLPAASVPNIERGMVLMFNCCLEGRKVNLDNRTGKLLNLDGFDAKQKRHPFLVLSERDKIKKEKYLTAIPITSSPEGYNQISGLPITSDMVNDKAQSLVAKNSILRVDAPTRLLKHHINNEGDRFIGEFNLGKPFDSIILEVSKHMGASLKI